MILAGAMVTGLLGVSDRRVARMRRMSDSQESQIEYRVEGDVGPMTSVSDHCSAGLPRRRRAG